MVHYLAVKSAIKVHDVPVYLYYSQEPEDNPLWDEISGLVKMVPVDPPTSFNGIELTSYQYKADVLRLQILQEQGGAYLDIDLISLKPFGDLWNESCVLGIENQEGTSITNAVILAEPNHEFINVWLERTGMNLTDRPWAWHGVCLPYEIYKEQDWSSVRLEPRSSFMPFDFRDPYIFTDDPSAVENLEHSYTMHMWDTIWNQRLQEVTAEYLTTSTSHLARICKDYLERDKMPTSNYRGKRFIEEQLKRMIGQFSCQAVLDIGAGAGIYHDLFNDVLPGAHWTAIEIWEPYIIQYRLQNRYQEVINQDARLVDYANMEKKFDVVFAGDVLEHMAKDEAVNLVNRVLDSHRCMMVSIPVVYMPQGTFEGNPYEAHVKDNWTDDEMRDTFGSDVISFAMDHEVGIYLLSRDEDLIDLFRPLRVAIYTICKNEEHNVEEWAKSNEEADYRLVCDTGSTDGTVEKLREQGVDVIPISVMPWRFDVARNASLNLLPPDVNVCIWQDLDERLLPGWRQELKKKWQINTTVAYHKYRNNENAWQWHSKIHARHGCHWTGPVHETLVWNISPREIWIPGIYLDEHQDTSKNRRGYLELLMKKVAEGACDWRTYFFLSNEYAWNGWFNDAMNTRIKSYEACSDDDPVTQSYVAKHIAMAWDGASNRKEAEHWHRLAIAHSDERESWLAYAEHANRWEDWDIAYLAIKRCLNVVHRRDGYTYDPRAWSHAPYDLGALIAYRMGLYQQAAEWGRKAIELCPEDERLKSNLKFYEENLPKPSYCESCPLVKQENTEVTEHAES